MKELATMPIAAAPESQQAAADCGERGRGSDAYPLPQPTWAMAINETERMWGDIDQPTEVNMTRREMLLMTASATVLGLTALIGFGGRNAIFADDEDEAQEALIKAMGAAKISLQQGLEASEQHGQPISAKFEIDEGKLQLSIYTAKDGKFSEVLVDYVTGKILKVEPVQGSDDLTAAHEQRAAMIKAKMSLKAAVDKIMSESANVRAVNVLPVLKDGHPVASIDVLNYNEIRAIQQSLD
jgi:hypothetical protein